MASRVVVVRPGEDPGSVVKADTTTLEVLGMKPEQLVTLEKGVHETVAYFKEYLDDR